MLNIYVGLFISIFALNLCYCEDVTIQMFSKRPLNRISDKYISFSVRPSDLLNIYHGKEETFLYKMMESGPCYLKVHGNDADQSNLFRDNVYNSSILSTQHFQDIYHNLRMADISPIIALPYDPVNWNTRNVIQMLGKFASLGMDHITWQLGSEFRVIETIGYIDDLSTLKLIVDAIATKHDLKHWTVIGSDITHGSGEDEAKMYSEYSKGVVEAVGWSQSIDLSHSDENVDDFFSNNNMDPALQTILNSDYPVWLTLTETQNQQKSPLTQMKQGLNLAQTLGDAAKGGFNVIYLPIDKNVWYEPSISYYVTLLHKRIIGRTVFDTKMFNGNRFDSHFYAHCTKNMSGSFSVVGVNAGDSKLDILAKLPFKSGTQYMEFILTVSVNGRVQLNGREIVEPAVLGPVPKSKLPGKATYLNMPAYSIAFWVFTEADVDECNDEESISYETDDDRLKTSSERLLQDLIVESVSRNDATNDRNSIAREKTPDVLKRSRRSIDHSPIQQELTNEIKSNGNSKGIKKSTKGFTEATKRSKRDINSLKSLFDKFDFKKSIFEFKTPPPFKIASPFLVPPIIQDVLQNPNEAEKKIFAPLDNPNLPDRDVHLEVAVDATVNTEKFNNGPNPNVNDGMVNTPQYTVNPANRLPSTALLGELTEIEVPQRNMNVAPIAKPPPKQENIQFVMKALPPTIHVNQENMERTRTNLRKNLWPMVNGQPMAKIPTFLPTMGQFQLPRIEAEQTFETRRRRRSINAEIMNDAIEKRIQGLSNGGDDSSADDNKMTVLAELLSMAEDIDKSERDQQSKQSPLSLGRSDFSAKLRGKLEQLSERGSDASLNLRKNDIWKKCKIIAKSVEQQCLQMDSKPVFRRSVKESIGTPIKKLLAKVKERFNTLVLRHKREIDFDDIDQINMIVKHQADNIMPKANSPFKLLQHSQKEEEDEEDKLEPSYDAKEQRLQGLFKSIDYIMNVINTIMGRISKFLDLSESN